VAISADATTAIVGGPLDDTTDLGAAWIFIAQPDLSITNSIVGLRFVAGQNLSYTISVTNNGPGAAANVS
jgi:hypothetical protein